MAIPSQPMKCSTVTAAISRRIRHVTLATTGYLVCRTKKGGTGYGDFKKELFEKLWEHFAPMRKRREEILSDRAYIDNVLARGAKRANKIADQVMARVRTAVGLR